MKHVSIQPKYTNQTARLSIHSIGSYVLAWKRGIAILTAGSVKVTPDPRVRLVNGYSLQIRDAVPQDAGDYICQIAMLDPREITHHVEILGSLQRRTQNKTGADPDAAERPPTTDEAVVRMPGIK
uniref:Ig-like domain-containing protein n=1 Tax=Anopheles culicifacies TaxID=139723 RepID=A0A182MDW8_9DIPT